MSSLDAVFRLCIRYDLDSREIEKGMYSRCVTDVWGLNVIAMPFAFDGTACPSRDMCQNPMVCCSGAPIGPQYQCVVQRRRWGSVMAGDSRPTMYVGVLS